MSLPIFPYHPDPLATGSVVESEAACAACGRARGYLYGGPVFAEEEQAFCPWCIADGTAAAAFDAEFTDVADAPADVPAEVLEAIAQRTPGFSGWQQERWLYHCGDGAAYLGSEGGDPAAHRFRCRHCGIELSYADSS